MYSLKSVYIANIYANPLQKLQFSQNFVPGFDRIFQKTDDSLKTTTVIEKMYFLKSVYIYTNPL